MRLDKFLKVSRLIKRRTVANEACDNARISVNGKPAKASYSVKPGDEIAIAFGSRTLKVEVLQVADNVRKDDAPETVRNRLEVYHRETEPLLDFYAERGKLKTVKNQPGIEATTAAIASVLGIEL